MSTQQSHRVVLFVDICHSTQLYENLGDKLAAKTIMNCLDGLRLRVEESGGSVIQRIGDELMCLFESPDTALGAARLMQQWTLQLEAPNDHALMVRIGCHFGPVLHENGDLFGDSVNVAARATAMAQAGQVITTEQTVAGLTSALRDSVRRLGGFAIKGKRKDVSIYELVWEPTEQTEAGTNTRTITALRLARLLLRYAGREFCLQARDGVALVLGRDTECDVVVSDPKASRRHARIETRRDKFVLADQSANGTYVKISDQAEIALRREELILSANGCIRLGRRAGGENIEPVVFSCE